MSACEGSPFLLLLADEDAKCLVSEDSKNTPESANVPLKDAEVVLNQVTDLPEAPEKPTDSLAQSTVIKGYALLSQAFKNDHPEMIEVFARNHIGVLSKGQNVSLTAGFVSLAQKYRLKVFEAELRNIETNAEPRNAAMFSRIFVNSYPPYWEHHRVPNSEPGWLNSTYGNLFNFTHFDCACFYNAIEPEILTVIEEALRISTLRIIDATYGHHKGGSFLHFAVKRNQTALAELLLKYGANKEAERDFEPFMDENECSSSELKALEEIRAEDIICSRPIFIAAKKGFESIVEVLLRYGVTRNFEIETTPLSEAFFYNHPEAYRLLLDAEAKINSNTYNQHTISQALLKSVEKHRPNFVEIILRHFPVPLSESNKITFYFAFLNSEASPDQMQCYEKMKEYGFRMDYDHMESPAPLLCGAIINNWVEIVRKVVEGGANVNEICNVRQLRLLPQPTGSHLSLVPYYIESSEPATDLLLAYEDYTPLHLAAAFAGEEVVQLLIAHGADINAKLGNRTPVYDACRTYNLNVLKFLMANGANVQHDPELICHAADCGHPQIVELLLLNRTPQSFKASELEGPLVKAAAKQHVDVMDILFRFGAQPSAKFALHCEGGWNQVPEGNHFETVRILLDHSFNNADFLRNSIDVSHFFKKYKEDPSVYTNCDYCGTYVGDCFNLLARHIIKLESASLNFFDMDVASFWYSKEILDQFRHNCVTEIVNLKTESVGRSNISFYDVLTGNTDQLATYARHKDFVETMKCLEYEREFPIYRSVLNCQFQKGYHRRDLLSRGVDICSKLSKTFKELPAIVKEEIVKYLNNYNLEVLSHEFVQFERSTEDS